MKQINPRQVGLQLASDPALYQAVLDVMSGARETKRRELEQQKVALEAQLAELDCLVPRRRPKRKSKSKSKSKKQLPSKPAPKAELVRAIRKLVKTAPRNVSGRGHGKPNMGQVIRGLNKKWSPMEIEVASKQVGYPVCANYVSVVRCGAR